MSKINVALIGCGYWGKNYLRLFNDMPEATVLAVCDKNEQIKAMVDEKSPHTLFTTDYRDVLNMADVDAVIIATITTSHYEIAKACITAGKHVLLEKPMTSTAAEGRALVRLAKEYNVKVMVGHIYMYNSAVQYAKQYLNNGDFGQLHYLYTQRTNLGPIRNDVGVVWDLAPHDISILNYLLDATPIWASAVGQNLSSNPQVDVAFITLGYPDNVVGHIHVSWADPNKVRDVTVVGSQRRIYLNDMDPQEPVRIFERGLEPSATDKNIENRFTIRDGDIISPRLSLSEPLREQAYEFINSILDDTEPLSNGENGVAVLSVLEAIERSMKQYGHRVEVTTALEVAHS